MSTRSAESAANDIVDALQVMSNASNRLVVTAQLQARAQGDPAIAEEIRTSVRVLLDDFARLRELLWALQSTDAAADLSAPRAPAPRMRV